MSRSSPPLPCSDTIHHKALPNLPILQNLCNADANASIKVLVWAYIYFNANTTLLDIIITLFSKYFNNKYEKNLVLYKNLHDNILLRFYRINAIMIAYNHRIVNTANIKKLVTLRQLVAERSSDCDIH